MPGNDWLRKLLVEKGFENDDAADWLVTANEFLDGESPLEMVRQGRQDRVAAAVDAEPVFADATVAA